jgi:hypothetical protein
MTGAKFKILIFLLVGIAVFIYYKLTNLLSKSGGKRVVEKCKSDPRYVNKIFESLDYLYLKKEFKETAFGSKISTISDNFPLEDHKILLLHKVDNDNYLFVTICSEDDFNVTVTGKMGDVKKHRQYNFKLNIDRQNNLLKAYSDPYSEREDRFLRENFLRKLYSYLLD